MIYLQRLSPAPSGGAGAFYLHGKAHALLAQALFPLFASNAPALDYDAYGRPFLPGYEDWQLSLSHCDGMAACVLNPFASGIDVEPLDRRVPSKRVIQRVLASSEAAYAGASRQPERTFFRFWTLKEALGKAMGVGLGYPLRDTSFSFDVYGRIFCSKPGFLFMQFFPEDAFVLSVCLSPGSSVLAKQSIGYVFRELPADMWNCPHLQGKQTARI